MTDAKETLTRDHAPITDAFAARRYFAKFEAITGHLGRVAAELESEGELARDEVEILGSYIRNLAHTFRALSNKYLMTGRETGSHFGSLAFDKHESGFPVHSELLTMANDAQQAERHLDGMASAARIKDDMVRQIVGDLTIPTKLQFAMSQRLYYEQLMQGELFWPQMHPQAYWLSGTGDRRRYMIHWAVYDSQINLPTIYLMEAEDTGRTSLVKDDRRWPAVQQHLIAQSMGGLKLLTIAKGFDQDFDDLHPKRLRRIHLGPMYSSAFTLQSGPIAKVLADAKAPQGQDWALAWTAALGKKDVVVRDSPGFASSRLGVALGLEAIRMVEEGVASAEAIDDAMRLGYKHPMGPLRLTDLVGLDVRLAIAEYLHATLGERFAPPRLLRDKVARGELGRSTGQGFHTWEKQR